MGEGRRQAHRGPDAALVTDGVATSTRRLVRTRWRRLLGSFINDAYAARGHVPVVFVDNETRAARDGWWERRGGFTRFTVSNHADAYAFLSLDVGTLTMEWSYCICRTTRIFRVRWSRRRSPRSGHTGVQFATVIRLKDALGRGDADGRLPLSGGRSCAHHLIGPEAPRRYSGPVEEVLRRSGGCNLSPYGAREIAVILESGDARGHRLARVSLTISTQHLFFSEPSVARRHHDSADEWPVSRRSPASGGGSPRGQPAGERTVPHTTSRRAMTGVPASDPWTAPNSRRMVLDLMTSSTARPPNAT